MTYVDDPQRVVLGWAEEESRAGLEVHCTTSTMAAALAVERFDRRVNADKPVRGKDIARVARVFIRHVSYWSVRRRDGRPVPRSVKGVLSLDRDGTLLPMLRQWMEVVRRPPQPVEETSGQPVEESSADVEAAAFLATFEARRASEPEPDEYAVQAADDAVQVVEAELVSTQ